MSRLIERLAELRRHLDHLRGLRPRVGNAADLERDLSLHNDVLYSLLMVCQLVIDIAGELCARKNLRFDDYTDAVRRLAAYQEFPLPMIEELTKLPGFRNVLVHEYVDLDMDMVVAALGDLEPIDEFLEAVLGIEEG